MRGMTRRFFGILVSVLAATTLVSGAAIAAEPRADENIVVVTPQNQQQVLDMSKEKLVIFDFGAEWCGACQELKPWLEEQARNDNGTWILAETDVDQNGDFADSYQIRYIPALIAHKDGQEMANGRGGATPEGQMMSREEIRQWIDQMIADFGAGTGTR